MPGIGLGLKIDAREVQALFKRAPEAATQRLRQLIESSAIDVQNELRRRVNVGATGETRRAIRYRVNPMRLEAEVRPELDERRIASLEDGSRPHWVSVKDGTPLAQWAKFRGVNKYAVQRSIASKGTRAHPFIKPTYNQLKPVVLRDIASGMARLAKELDSGRL